MITVYTEQDVPKNYMARQYQMGNNGQQYQVSSNDYQYQTGNNGYHVRQQYVYDPNVAPVQQQPDTSKGRKFVIIFGALGCCILITLISVFVLLVIMNNWGYLQ